MPLHVVDGMGDLLGLIRDDLPVRTAALKLAAARRDPAIRATSDTTTTSRPPRSAGCATRLPGTPTSPGCCSSRWSVRIFRSSRARRSTGSIRKMRCHGRRSTRKANGRIIPISTRCASAWSTTRHSTKPRMRRAIAALFRHGHVPRRQRRQDPVDARGNGLRAGHARHLHERSRRQPRHPRLVGQVDDVRGVGRRSPHRGRSRRSVRHGVPRAGRRWSTAFRPSSRRPACRRIPTIAIFRVTRCSSSRAGSRRRRTVLCEYHAAGGATGAFMTRHGPFKLVHYVGMRPMLFDLVRDPQERLDLGTRSRLPGFDSRLPRRSAAHRRPRSGRSPGACRPGGAHRTVRRSPSHPGARLLQPFSNSRRAGDL